MDDKRKVELHLYVDDRQLASVPLELTHDQYVQLLSGSPRLVVSKGEPMQFEYHFGAPAASVAEGILVPPHLGYTYDPDGSSDRKGISCVHNIYDGLGRVTRVIYGRLTSVTYYGGTGGPPDPPPPEADPPQIVGE